MIREIDELKAVSYEQLHRNRQTFEQTQSHQSTSTDLQSQIYEQKRQLETKSNRALQLGVEISERKKELALLKSQREEEQSIVDEQKQVLETSQTDEMEAAKEQLAEKVESLRETEELKESTQRQVSDVSIHIC